jgi:hypothetical protein
MGILDDAIRQHLELKRRQGADDDELKRLEDEAFGPPTRPGEPDFPGEAVEAAIEGNGSEAAAPAVEESPIEAALPAEDFAAAQPPPVEAPAPLEPVEAEPAPEPEAPEPKPPEPEPAEPDAPEVGEIDLDLERELDEVRDIDEAEAGEPASDETASEPAAAPPEAPIESLDTVEHDVAEVLDEPAPAEEVLDEPAPEEAEGEDVLEETPEFLQDAPEDDELWFEQGKPKDFDF